MSEPPPFLWTIFRFDGSQLPAIYHDEQEALACFDYHSRSERGLTLIRYALDDWA